MHMLVLVDTCARQSSRCSGHAASDALRMHTQHGGIVIINPGCAHRMLAGVRCQVCTTAMQQACVNCCIEAEIIQVAWQAARVAVSWAPVAPRHATACTSSAGLIECMIQQVHQRPIHVPPAVAAACLGCSHRHSKVALPRVRPQTRWPSSNGWRRWACGFAQNGWTCRPGWSYAL